MSTITCCKQCTMKTNLYFKRDLTPESNTITTQVYYIIVYLVSRDTGLKKLQKSKSQHDLRKAGTVTAILEGKLTTLKVLGSMNAGRFLKAFS